SSAYCAGAITAAAFAGYTRPKLFWEGVAERRARHGFLVIFDEVVTGVGRVGEWFAGAKTACPPDMIATAKGLGAGYAAIGAVLIRDRVYEAIANGSRKFTLGHTWDGAPLPCAVGLAVLHALRTEGWIDHVRDRGRQLRDELEAALDGVEMVHEVRGHGYLLGVSFVDPRNGRTLLPWQIRVGAKVDDASFRRNLIT